MELPVSLQHSEKVWIEMRDRLVGLCVEGLAICAILLGLAHAAETGWSLSDFTGNRMDYALWLRDADGSYLTDDDPEYEWSGLLNNALLTLAFGPRQSAWSGNPLPFTDGTAQQAYYDQMLWAVRESYVPEDANRVWADVLDTYLSLKHLFTKNEQREIERFMCLKAKTYGEAKQRRAGHQNVPTAFAALTAHVLSESTTGDDYSNDIRWLWSYAEEKGTDFGESFGPGENSGHYVMYVYDSMLRISIWGNGRRGKLPESHRANLRKAVEWILDVYPHNGFAVTYGTEWIPAHVPRLVGFLHAAAHYLSQGSLEDMSVARQAKWMATQMFRFGFEHTAALDSRIEWTPHDVHRQVKSSRWVQVNPIWLWSYIDDSLTPEMPDEKAHCSKIVYGEYGEQNTLKPSKVVHRSGWGRDALYLLIDLAPKAPKSMPYANAICDISFGSETFTPGHNLEQGNAGNQQQWDERIVVEPHNDDRWEAGVEWMENFDLCSASRTREGDWNRFVTLVKDFPYAVVFDFTREEGSAHWQFVSDPPPSWSSKGVILTKHGETLRVLYAHKPAWYKAIHWEDSRIHDGNPRTNVWAVDDPARRLKLAGGRAWAAVILPGSDGVVRSISPIEPKQGGNSAYPQALGVRMEWTNATAWLGACTTPGLCTYDDIETDAELFFFQKTPDVWRLCVVHGTRLLVPHAGQAEIACEAGSPAQATVKQNTLDIRFQPSTVSVLRIRPVP